MNTGSRAVADDPKAVVLRTLYGNVSAKAFCDAYFAQRFLGYRTFAPHYGRGGVDTDDFRGDGRLRSGDDQEGNRAH